MDQHVSVLWGPMDFELEERTAFSFQLNPFGQLISANLLGVHLEGVTIRQRTFSCIAVGAPRRVVRTASFLEEVFR